MFLNDPSTGGCDGTTYGNECGAQAVGVSILAKGECPDDSKVDDLTGTVTEAPPASTTTAAAIVGESCEVGPGVDGNSMCRRGEYCMVPDGGEACGGLRGVKGVCTAMPEMCMAIYDPVCKFLLIRVFPVWQYFHAPTSLTPSRFLLLQGGCDGKTTYGSQCSAAASGVNVLFSGECPKPEEVAPLELTVVTKPALVGGSYCTWGPEYECYESGWPSCCGSEDTEVSRVACLGFPS